MSELSEAINEMRNMRKSYDQIAEAAEAYNTGKADLAENITSKGVEASATETLPELAEKVNAISQETYEINGGEMYAKQLFGSLETPNYWNLYEVLAQLLSDGRLVNYGGILLAEYYKGYDSLALSGAGAGGVYVVSDKDANGNFIMYTNDTTHVWDTEEDGKGNRWVAYCFADEYHDFQITDTNTSPRSIFIGRKVGTITSLVNGRVSKIVVPDGNDFNGFSTGGYTQNFDSRLVIKNINHTNGRIVYNPQATESIYLGLKSYAGKNLITANNVGGKLSAVIINADAIDNIEVTESLFNGDGGARPSLSYFGIYGIKSIYARAALLRGIDGNSDIIITAEEIDGYNTQLVYNSVFKRLFIPNLELFRSVGAFGLKLTYSCTYDYLYIGYSLNDKTKSITLVTSGDSPASDIELKNGYCKPINISTFTNLTEANMYAHILQKLKQDEPNCGDGVTITLGSTNLAKLTSEESVQLLDDLTNIYGYTFA